MRMSRPDLFACLADGGGQHLFATIDEAAGEHPLPIARLDRAADEDDVIVGVADDRADRDLRILIEDEPAPRCRPAGPVPWV